MLFPGSLCPLLLQAVLLPCIVSPPVSPPCSLVTVFLFSPPPAFQHWAAALGLEEYVPLLPSIPEPAVLCAALTITPPPSHLDASMFFSSSRVQCWGRFCLAFLAQAAACHPVAGSWYPRLAPQEERRRPWNRFQACSCEVTQGDCEAMLCVKLSILWGGAGY